MNTSVAYLVNEKPGQLLDGAKELVLGDFIVE